MWIFGIVKKWSYCYTLANVEIIQKEARRCMRGQKFINFENYLKNNSSVFLEFSFEQIESIIEQNLCSSAYQHEAYWYLSDTHTFPLSWINAGYKIENLDLLG